MERQKDETIVVFNRIFQCFYFKIPKEIQPSETASRLCYATSFHSDIALHLMERKFMALHQMFNDAQET